MDKQIALVDRTELNGMVIDVKDATGYVSYATDVPLAKELKLEERRIRDIDALMATLQEHKIVPIARIVCFNDPILAKRRPEYAVKSKGGGIWKDKKRSVVHQSLRPTGVEVSGRSWRGCRRPRLSGDPVRLRAFPERRKDIRRRVSRRPRVAGRRDRGVPCLCTCASREARACGYQPMSSG